MFLKVLNLIASKVRPKFTHIAPNVPPKCVKNVPKLAPR